MQVGLNGIIRSAALSKNMRAVHYEIILVITIKFKETYCVSYLYPSKPTTEKGADALSGQHVNIPMDQVFGATKLS